MSKKEKQAGKENPSEKNKQKKFPDTIQEDKKKDFEKSKIRNKGKASSGPLGGSLADSKKKTKLL
ncbi:MAG: hypothetical protein M3Q58_00315 [Bacteroidota bacterium]|nr:hypothetical protein [Bacteroidota bacterium]